jgi:hypothetical protein
MGRPTCFRPLLPSMAYGPRSFQISHSRSALGAQGSGLIRLYQIVHMILFYMLPKPLWIGEKK